MFLQLMPFKFLAVQWLILAIGGQTVFSRPSQEPSNTRQRAHSMQNYVNEKLENIPITSKLDEAKKQLICSFSDIIQPADHQRTKRQTSKWDHLDLTWSLRNTLKNVNIKWVKWDINRALQVWSKYSPLRFREADSEFADIQVSFVKGDHGDGYSFEGDKIIYAHGFPPGKKIGGDVHFNSEIQWLVTNQTSKRSNGISLFYTAVHEFGHALGLPHSMEKSSIMYQWYQDSGSDFELPKLDQKSIQNLYGKCMYGSNSIPQNWHVFTKAQNLGIIEQRFSFSFPSYIYITI